MNQEAGAHADADREREYVGGSAPRDDAAVQGDGAIGQREEEARMAREEELRANLEQAREDSEKARLDFVATREARSDLDAATQARQRWEIARSRERRIEQMLLTIPGRGRFDAGRRSGGTVRRNAS